MLVSLHSELELDMALHIHRACICCSLGSQTPFFSVETLLVMHMLVAWHCDQPGSGWNSCDLLLLCTRDQHTFVADSGQLPNI